MSWANALQRAAYLLVPVACVGANAFDVGQLHSTAAHEDIPRPLSHGKFGCRPLLSPEVGRESSQFWELMPDRCFNSVSEQILATRAVPLRLVLFITATFGEGSDLGGNALLPPVLAMRID